jgi:Uma2 family endonuclease
VTAGARSVPQPDVALLKPRADNYFSRHPDPSEVVLLIEVADTTLRFDLATKIPLYARAGMAEVWVVDLAQRAVHVFRAADTGGYRSSFIVSGEQRVSPEALPDISLAVSELFPA